jgi:hypothetical protein
MFRRHIAIIAMVAYVVTLLTTAALVMWRGVPG